MSRYGSAPYAWDVVNKAVNDNLSDGLFKHNVWYPDLPDYVDFAFKTAREANSDVKLFYNDYNIASSQGIESIESKKKQKENFRIFMIRIYENLMQFIIC